jgi:hypothetical protein
MERAARATRQERAKAAALEERVRAHAEVRAARCRSAPEYPQVPFEYIAASMPFLGRFGAMAWLSFGRAYVCVCVDVRPCQAERKLAEQLASLDIFKLDVIAREMKRSASVLPRRCRRLQCRVSPCEYPETTPRVPREYPVSIPVTTL